jgi:hypothetical protein
VTKRKPLEWLNAGMDGDYLIPDCFHCQKFLLRPGMGEAIASVGIEHPGAGKRAVEQYHANRHREGP